LDVIERRIWRIACASEDPVVSEAKVTAHSNRTDFQHLAFDFRQSLLDV
jgi:hypothetical protein